LHAAIADEATNNGITFSAQVSFLLAQAMREKGVEPAPELPDLHQSASKRTRSGKSASKRTPLQQLDALWCSQVPWATISSEGLEEFLKLADGSAELVESAIRITAERIPNEKRRNAVGYCRTVLTNMMKERQEKKAEQNPPGLKPDLTPEELAEKKAYAREVAKQLGWGE
jgi:hypothetical protein